MKNIAMYCSHPILVAGLRNLVEQIPGFVFSAAWPKEDSVTDEACRTGSPDVFVVDVTPAVTLSALHCLKESAPGVAIVLWLDSIAIEYAIQALQMGIQGIVLKTAPLESHLECLRQVAAGHIWIQNEISNKLLSTKQTNLTRRERQLMGLLAQGLKNKQIAWQLQISEGTVKVYLSHLFRKVGVSDRFELALLALRNMVPEQGEALGNDSVGGNGSSYLISNVISIAAGASGPGVSARQVNGNRNVKTLPLPYSLSA
jgi:DNA-binding NarL/FixJ family response regulator